MLWHKGLQYQRKNPAPKGPESAINGATRASLAVSFPRDLGLFQVIAWLGVAILQGIAYAFSTRRG